MVTKKVWLGSTGPFLYDDSVLYLDEDGVISPDNQQAIATDGQMVVQSPPSSPVHVVRKQDLDDALIDIASVESRVDSLETRITSAESRLLSLETRATSLETRATNLEVRATNLEGKFTTGSFTMYVGGFTASFTPIVAYIKVDRIIFLSLPFIDGTSASSTIILGGFPAAIYPFVQTFNEPIYVYSATYGNDWAYGTLFTPTDAFWHITITPIIKSAAFPTTGRKILYPQVLKYTV